MHVTRSVRMSVQLLEHLSYRAVVGDRVRHRPDRLKPEIAVLVRPQDAPTIRVCPLRVLRIVVAGLVRLPDIDRCADDRAALCVLESASDKTHLALAVGTD